MCIDYSALNQQTTPDKYLLLGIDDLLDWLVNAYCFNSIDLHTGYYNLTIHAGDAYKTAFLSKYVFFWVSCVTFWLKKYPLYVLKINK